LRRSSTQANYTVSGHDLTRHVMAEAQHAGMAPMERFLRE
jgi:hypothetical protein